MSRHQANGLASIQWPRTRCGGGPKLLPPAVILHNGGGGGGSSGKAALGSGLTGEVGTLEPTQLPRTPPPNSINSSALQDEPAGARKADTDIDELPPPPLPPRKERGLVGGGGGGEQSVMEMGNKRTRRGSG